MAHLGSGGLKALVLLVLLVGCTRVPLPGAAPTNGPTRLEAGAFFQFSGGAGDPFPLHQLETLLSGMLLTSVGTTAAGGGPEDPTWVEIEIDGHPVSKILAVPRPDGEWLVIQIGETPAVLTAGGELLYQPPDAAASAEIWAVGGAVPELADAMTLGSPPAVTGVDADPPLVIVFRSAAGEILTLVGLPG